MRGTKTRAGFVATNSLCQGIAVPPLWEHLEGEGFHIDFAHKSFLWESDSNEKAHVHVVIVGFSHAANPGERTLFDNGRPLRVENINAYLFAAPNIIVKDVLSPVSGELPTSVGSFATDGGYLILDAEQKKELLEKEPAAEPLLRTYFSPEDFINNEPRFCLWLKNASPNLLKDLPPAHGPAGRRRSCRTPGGGRDRRPSPIRSATSRPAVARSSPPPPSR